MDTVVTGSDGSAVKSSPLGATPDCTSRAPNAATIAPLSVHRESFGTTSRIPCSEHRSETSCLSLEFAATPPPSNKVSMPFSVQASMALDVTTSATAS